MEEWEKLKSVDIRTVNRDGLIDVTRIPEDDSDDVDKEMQMRTFLRNVKMKIAIKVWKKGKFCANICIGLNE